MKNDFGRDILKGSPLPFDRETSQRAVEKFFTYEQPSRLGFSPDGRRMNHFCLGADPEFMFIQGREPVHATHLGLKAGLAFGADQNDRLVELRAAPSRDAIRVLGSILAELRWLYRYLGETHRSYEWHASAFAHGDGMGGHVHFGRKRPNQAEEVRGLDGLARVMRAVDLFDTTGWKRRAEGDQYNQLYGQYGDIRPQKHGYEYRTLPTWLDSPRLAYLVLVLSKLVILDPDITDAWNHKHSPGHTWALLQGLAKYYKGRDDDALILYSMMDNPDRFRFVGGDFRLRWGLNGETKKLSSGCIIPAVIEGTDDDLLDLSLYLTEGKVLPMRECAPNFRDSIPKDYQWVPATLEYRRRPNIGDIFYDMVQFGEMRFAWDFDSRGCTVFAPVAYDRTELNKIAEGIEIRPSGGSNWTVRIGNEWRKGASLAHLRRVLYSGLLPLWKVDDVEGGSFKRWQETTKTVKPPMKQSKYAAVMKGL